MSRNARYGRNKTAALSAGYQYLHLYPQPQTGTCVSAGEVGISAITGAELSFGVAKSASQRNQDALAKFLAPLEILPFDEQAMQVYGALRRDLERLGTPIGPLDTLIAAHALSLDAILVTNNLRKFSRVKNLRLENWAEHT